MNNTKSNYRYFDIKQTLVSKEELGLNEEQVQEMQRLLQQKINGYSEMILKSKFDINLFEHVIEKYQNLKKEAEKKIDHCKDRLSDIYETFYYPNKKKIEITDEDGVVINTVSVRTTPTLFIEYNDKIPEEFIHEEFELVPKYTRKVDEKALKQAIINKEVLNGDGIFLKNVHTANVKLKNTNEQD